MVLEIDEFIHRFLQHVPPPGLHTVRSYGVYANNQVQELSRCRQLLGQSEIPAAQTVTADEILEKLTNGQHDRCPVCNRKLVVVATLASSRGPPAQRAA